MNSTKYGKKIQSDKPVDKMREDVERYCVLAKERGAAEAKMISSSEVIVDQRVKFKCQYPVCGSFGTSMNCPPYTANSDETKELLELYSYGVLMMFKYPAARMMEREKRVLDGRNLAKVIAAVESSAFYDGHYLSIGFGAGSCKSTWCNEQTSCSSLEGKGCRHDSFARASMEGVGMDVYKMAAKQGWDIYPIGKSCTSVDVPEGIRLSLVLIG